MAAVAGSDGHAGFDGDPVAMAGRRQWERRLNRASWVFLAAFGVLLLGLVVAALLAKAAHGQGAGGYLGGAMVRGTTSGDCLVFDTARNLGNALQQQLPSRLSGGSPLYAQRIEYCATPSDWTAPHTAADYRGYLLIQASSAAGARANTTRPVFAVGELLRRAAPAAPALTGRGGYRVDVRGRLGIIAQGRLNAAGLAGAASGDCANAALAYSTLCVPLSWVGAPTLPLPDGAVFAVDFIDEVAEIENRGLSGDSAIVLPPMTFNRASGRLICPSDCRALKGQFPEELLTGTPAAVYYNSSANRRRIGVQAGNPSSLLWLAAPDNAGWSAERAGWSAAAVGWNGEVLASPTPLDGDSLPDSRIDARGTARIIIGDALTSDNLEIFEDRLLKIVFINDPWAKWFERAGGGLMAQLLLMVFSGVGVGAALYKVPMPAGLKATGIVAAMCIVGAVLPLLFGQGNILLPVLLALIIAGAAGGLAYFRR